MRLPDFLCLGTQKGGTTSLHRLLRQHPQVYLPACKEIHYFSLHDDHPPEWYAEHYSAAKETQFCGDITPYYLFHPRACRGIHQLMPEAKLIVLLRDPVERTLSQYFHARRLGFETLELTEALAAEEERLSGAATRLTEKGSTDFSHQKHSYVSRSRYELQLQDYEQLFRKDQIFTIRSEDFFAYPERFWLRIQTFLNLDPIRLPTPMSRANAGTGEASCVDESIRQQLRVSLQPTVAEIRKRYGFDWGW